MNPPPRILVVEDSAKDAEIILNALQKHNLGNTADWVRDGVEALDYLHRREKFAGRADELPLLVLLDLKMPRLDGLEVLRQLKTDARLRRVPIVMMTSSREETDLVRSYDLGVNSYVVKPVQFHAFVEAVSKLKVYWVLVNEAPPGLAPNGGPPATVDPLAIKP